MNLTKYKEIEQKYDIHAILESKRDTTNKLELKMVKLNYESHIIMDRHYFLKMLIITCYGIKPLFLPGHITYNF